MGRCLLPPRGRMARPAAATEPIGPDTAALRAQDRAIKAGGKLSDPEKFKRELHPFDAYERLKEQAAKNEAPKADDNFRWRFFGLFYCAPAQKSYMCRLRIPNGILTHWQFAGVADLAERYAGGYAHVTTRANLQMREVEPKNAVAMVEAIQDLRPVLARFRRRQYPQRYRHADRRHRPAGTDRHPALCPRMAFSHSQRSLAVRHPAQIQCRLRRRRRHPGARGHQRHRISGCRGKGWSRHRARHLVPADARRRDRSSHLCRRYRRDRQAGGGNGGGRRRGAGLYRSWRPHQSRQGAPEICARRLGL